MRFESFERFDGESTELGPKHSRGRKEFLIKEFLIDALPTFSKLIEFQEHFSKALQDDGLFKKVEPVLHAADFQTYIRKVCQSSIINEPIRVCYEKLRADLNASQHTDHKEISSEIAESIRQRLLKDAYECFQRQFPSLLAEFGITEAEFPKQLQDEISSDYRHIGVKRVFDFSKNVFGIDRLKDANAKAKAVEKAENITRAFAVARGRANRDIFAHSPQLADRRSLHAFPAFSPFAEDSQCPREESNLQPSH
jgi:hypothetical protein